MVKWHTSLQRIFEGGLQTIPSHSQLSLQKCVSKIFELLPLQASRQQCFGPISGRLGVPACQEALFLSKNGKWRLEMACWILTNLIILLLISFIQNARVKHTFIVSNKDFYVNLYMASQSLQIYMQESQRPGAGMCGCLCMLKWQTFLKYLWTLSLPPLSPNLLATWCPS